MITFSLGLINMLLLLLLSSNMLLQSVFSSVTQRERFCADVSLRNTTHSLTHSLTALTHYSNPI